MGAKPRYTVQLDAINFALADAKGAFGPYVGIFLLTQAGWSQAAIGAFKTFGGLLSLVLNTPIGALMDATRLKRAAIIAAVFVLAAGAVAIALAPTLTVVILATAAIAVAGDVFAPATAALTLGLLAPALYAKRFGRNSAFDHAGNVVIALLAAAVGWWLGQRAVFFLVPLFAVVVAMAVLSIPAAAIDHERARGGVAQRDRDGRPAAQPADLRILIACRPLVVFALCTALFHFANAPMLHLVGQKLALAHPGHETIVMSACVIAAQTVMIGMALLAGAKADAWGRKPLLLAGFAILPIRGMLYTVSDEPAWLIGVQLLDGIGNGLYGALAPLVLADLMHGTGRYNVARGMVATAHGIGASVSHLAAGMVVVRLGYEVAFAALALVALLAFVVLLLAMSETRDPLGRADGREPSRVQGRKHEDRSGRPHVRPNGEGNRWDLNRRGSSGRSSRRSSLL